jgi:hypothetical protein
METKGSASIEIRASPDRVYNLLIDFDRIGEISPECYRAEWLEGLTGPHAGGKFRGYNRSGKAEWQTECRVLRAMPGVEWAFKANAPSPTPTTWRYTFARTEEGCIVTESFDAPVLATTETQEALGGRDAQLRTNISTTLANLKKLAEA